MAAGTNAIPLIAILCVLPASAANAGDASALDDYTRNAVVTLGTSGYRAFAGQRDDAFYGDINSIFDLLALRSGANNRFDSQSGFNVHLMILEIPVTDIAGGENQTMGVYATTSRRATTVLTDGAGSAGTTATGGSPPASGRGSASPCRSRCTSSAAVPR